MESLGKPQEKREVEKIQACINIKLNTANSEASELKILVRINLEWKTI